MFSYKRGGTLYESRFWNTTRGTCHQMSGHLINGDDNDGSWPNYSPFLDPQGRRCRTADDDGVHTFCKVNSSFAQLFNWECTEPEVFLDKRAWDEPNGGRELASQRNKKARDFTDPFIYKSTLLSIPFRHWMLPFRIIWLISPFFPFLISAASARRSASARTRRRVWSTPPSSRPGWGKSKSRNLGHKLKQICRFVLSQGKSQEKKLLIQIITHHAHQVRPRLLPARLLDGHPSRDRHARRLQRRQQDRPPQRRLPQQARNHSRPRIVSNLLLRTQQHTSNCLDCNVILSLVKT